MEISVSKLKLFKACRRAYELKYIEELEPVNIAPALQTGLAYHEKIEQLHKTGKFDIDEWTIENAMVVAYETGIYPKLPELKATEQPFEFDLDGTGRYLLVGRLDGIAINGLAVEHKTTGATNLDEYEYGLQWNEQILAYMLATGNRNMYYTIVRKPTIRRKKTESDNDFFNRCLMWYAENPDATRLLTISRTQAQILDFKQELLAMCKEIERTENFYKNTAYCSQFGRRCEYSSICLNYDPDQIYIEFTRRKDDGNTEI